MTAINERITALAELVDPDAEEKETAAELCAYAAAIGVIQEDFEQLETELSFESPQGHTLDLLSNMFCISSSLSADEKRERIAERFKEVVGDSTSNALKSAAEAYSGIQTAFYDSPKRFAIESGSVTQSGLIGALGRILKNYLSPCHYVVITDGDGVDFDFWDAAEYTFNAYERLDLPFYILDQMN